MRLGCHRRGACSLARWAQAATEGRAYLGLENASAGLEKPPELLENIFASLEKRRSDVAGQNGSLPLAIPAVQVEAGKPGADQTRTHRSSFDSWPQPPSEGAPQSEDAGIRRPSPFGRRVWKHDVHEMEAAPLARPGVPRPELTARAKAAGPWASSGRGEAASVPRALRPPDKCRPELTKCVNPIDANRHRSRAGPERLFPPTQIAGLRSLNPW